MTSEQLAAIVGAILSLAFFYIPVLKDKFGAVDARVKALVMLVLNVVVALAVFGMACANVLNSVTCDAQGAFALVNLILASVMGNQGTFLLFRKLTGAPAPMPTLRNVPPPGVLR